MKIISANPKIHSKLLGMYSYCRQNEHTHDVALNITRALLQCQVQCLLKQALIPERELQTKLQSHVAIGTVDESSPFVY
jgi:hypothetical protein